MATITHDDRSFMLDGRRIWLVSGSVHYFRTPAALWADRLLKAKRAGLNCVTTYVAWNFHEPTEGRWNLDGDRDVAAFVRLAGEMGLYVILRPGPYICSEWDFGGLPAWLTTKTGMGYRTSNAAFMHYFDKYFGQVLPRLAEHQVINGGPIVLIQNENEYFMRTMPDRQNYLEFINQLFRRGGFDIPIINCNFMTDPPVADNIECVNAWENAVQQLKQLRRRQEAPSLVTEYWAGWLDNWGGEHEYRDGRTVARRALEILGCGAQYNYYMWHGGTNFGFYAGRNSTTEASWQTTSYDYDAPLAEGGGLTPKYYQTRLVNVLGSTMGARIAQGIGEEPSATIHDATCALNVRGPEGNWAIVTNSGRDDIESVTLNTAEGKTLEVSLSPLGAVAIPSQLVLDEEYTLDYANLMPLGLFGGRMLVLHGPAGWDARYSVNGVETRVEVPDDERIETSEHGELRVVVINSDLAMRTWWVDDTLVFGPTFVGETLEELTHAKNAKQYALMTVAEGLANKKIKAEDRPAKPTTPRLGQWKRLGVCNEPTDDELEWRGVSGPIDVDSLGVHYGYVWYRAEIEQDRAKKRNLFLPECADRATIYLNGELLGTWGDGEEATREPMGANFKRGANTLTMLLDNLGRFCDWPKLGETKGISDHVYDAKPVKYKKPRLKQQEGFTRRIIPREHSWMIPKLERQAVYTAEIDVTLTSVVPLHLAFDNVPHDVALQCNGRTVRFMPKSWSGTNFDSLTLGSELKKGKNTLVLTLWGEVDAATLKNFRIYSLNENLSAGASWGVRTWEMPEPGGPVVGKNCPAWYVANFKHDGHAGPLFLHIIGAKKGQIFLNGRNLGRYWTVGPQRDYYLPDCWLEAENELTVFDETGSIPAGSKIVVRSEGPYAE